MMADLLVLGMGRLPHGGITLAGMTTEADPITGRRWVRPMREHPLAIADLRYADGTLVRLGDVLVVELGEERGEQPFVENVRLESGVGPPQLLRHIAPTKQPTFLSSHLDPDPLAVLTRNRSRSLCLVQPETPVATFSIDEETQQYEARLEIGIAGRRPHQGVLVTDVYWRAWGRRWVSEDEPFAELPHDELERQIGQLYLVFGVGSAGGVSIIGVHTVPEYKVALNEAEL
ncbi:MAG: hypothetical protein NVS4B8_09930 [Herpetosiphon sp.]